MDELKNYVVTTKKGINISSIKQDVVRDTSKDSSINASYIPTRSIDIGILPITASNRNTSFLMTKKEAQILRQNPNIEAVQLLSTSSDDAVTGSLYYTPDARIPGYWNNNEFVGGDSSVCYISTESINVAKVWMTNNYNLGSSSLAALLHNEINPFPQYYGQTLNGEGVDLIVIDLSVDLYHQEFLKDPNQGIINFRDPENYSRAKFIKWFEFTNTEGVDPPAHNNFLGGDHGLKCASIAAGNVYGWAPKAEVYFMRVSSTDQSSTDSYSPYDVFPLIRKFHEQKIINPLTGFKRPTVVSMSTTQIHRPYQAIVDGENITHIDQFYPLGISANLTGNNNTASVNLGFTNPDVFTKNYLTSPGSLVHNKWIPSINADADECSEIGVIICHAAGNRYMPQAGSGSVDDPFFEEDYYSPYWNSYYTYDQDNSRYEAGEPVYYHRPGYPGGNSVVKCANISFKFVKEINSQVDIAFGLIESSERGPRIDIGAISHVNCAASFWNPRDGDTPISHSLYSLPLSSFNRNYIGNTYNGGTSFAAPQIAGLACLWAQLNPGGNVIGFKKFLKENANPNSIKHPTYLDMSDENGTLYYPGNLINSTVNTLIIPSAHYRNSANPIKLANWPYSSPNQATFSNIKITTT